MNTKETTISNWTIFGASSVSIELFKHTNEDAVVYNSSLGIFLDDGNNEEERYISICTDVWEECPHCCIVKTVEGAIGLFAGLCDTVFTTDESGDIVEEYKLSEIMGSDDNTNILPATTTLQ